ncbi:AI-2E family transporter [soil metagenome]
MPLQRQVIFWAVALLALILSLWLLSDILLPFLAGLVLAYFLDPIADFLQRRGLPRVVATSLILLTSLVAFGVLLLLLVPVLANQIGAFAGKLPDYFRTLLALFDSAAPQWVKDMLAGSGTNMSDIASRAAVWVGTLLASIWSGGLALVNILSLLVITPIVAFYMLNDWDHMVTYVDGLVPRHHLDTVRSLAREIDNAMAGFIRGQGTVCIVLGLFYAVGLSLAGLNFALLIGIGAGLLSFVPYVGSIIGGVTAISLALVQFWPDWVSVIIVAAIFGAGQFIEGNFLSPKLVGNRVGLHPVWLMFALFAFGYIFGFVGLLLAVPLAAAAGVLTRFAIRQYRKSALYGAPPPVETPARSRAARKS